MEGEGWEQVVEPVREQLLATEASFGDEMSVLSRIVQDVRHPALRVAGKRVRPLLLLLVAATGRPPWGKARTAARAVEMVHTASLLHDDVLDDAVVRRGTATVCATVGAKRAVLAGDVLYCRALEGCLREGLKNMALLLAAAARQMSEAEAEQTSHDGDLGWSVEDYMGVIRGKTGSLFRAAATGGSLLSGREGCEETFGRFGLHLGTAFQIADDVLDYHPGQPGWGKESLADLRQRKATLPLLIAREAGALERWPSPAEAYSLLRRCGALDRALEIARAEANLALLELRRAPQGAAEAALRRLAALVVERTE
jgi:octaprenyl-diphosphate synthase